LAVRIDALASPELMLAVRGAYDALGQALGAVSRATLGADTPWSLPYPPPTNCDVSSPRDGVNFDFAA